MKLEAFKKAHTFPVCMSIVGKKCKFDDTSERNKMYIGRSFCKMNFKKYMCFIYSWGRTLFIVQVKN